MSGRIQGINRTSLWDAWKVIRRLLRDSSLRGVVDFLEYDIDPKLWIDRLLKQIKDGHYEPRTPIRYTTAKSKGLSRRMTLPSIPDLVLYRAIVDYLYAKAKRREKKHVYFDVSTLSRVRNEAVSSAQKLMKKSVSNYELGDVYRFLSWLRYDQYRKYLILEKVYPYIVTTDIANFFDSVLYSRVAESLYGLPVPPRMVGLLFFILERLSIREPYTESPRIGLPVDEFDCSRKLAHIILFPYDDRMVEEVGEDAYVRWMDDQNIGVSSRAEGLKVLSAVGDSLARIHLTPNPGKSQILSLQEARRHFHLDINKRLNNADKLPSRTIKQRKALADEIERIWGKSQRHEGKGEWTKVLKWMYRLAGLVRTRIFRARAIDDLLENPELARRIVDYMRCSGTVSQYLDFFNNVCFHEEQVYPDVNLVLFESLLRLEAKGSGASRIRQLASELLAGKLNIPGASLCQTVAPLLILRFGDRRSLRLLRGCFEKRLDTLPQWAVIAAGVVYASYGIGEFRQLESAGRRLRSNYLLDILELIERVLNFTKVPGRYKARLNLRRDSVAGKEFIDMRSIVAARLLQLNSNPQVASWLASNNDSLLQSDISRYDKELVRRLLT